MIVTFRKKGNQVSQKIDAVRVLDGKSIVSKPEAANLVNVPVIHLDRASRHNKTKIDAFLADNPDFRGAFVSNVTHRSSAISWELVFPTGEIAERLGFGVDKLSSVTRRQQWLDGQAKKSASLECEHGMYREFCVQCN